MAAVFGFVDWLAIPSVARAKTIGLLHGGENVVVTLLFIITSLLRRPTPEHPGAAAFSLSFCCGTTSSRDWLARSGVG